MSAKISAVISGVSGWVPDEKLTNQQLSTMVDTSDEWITTRTGIKRKEDTQRSGKSNCSHVFNGS